MMLLPGGTSAGAVSGTGGSTGGSAGTKDGAGGTAGAVGGGHVTLSSAANATLSAVAHKDEAE
eukprot:578393-Rhodomonas_salina.1